MKVFLRARKHRSVPIGLAVLLVLGLGLFGVPAQAAEEYPASAELTISRTSGSPLKSGEQFRYAVNFACSQLGEGGGSESATCDSPVITIPLGADLEALVGAGHLSVADFAINNLPYGHTFDIVGGDLVIALDDVPVGSSFQFELAVRPRNEITATGTAWEFLPTVRGDNFADVTAPRSADGETTATLAHSINKSVVGNAFRHRGDQVSYDIVVSCTRTPTGMIVAETMTVTDTIPEHLTFVSADPAPDSGAPAGPLVWNLSGAELPGACTEGGSGDAIIEVTAEVANTAPYGTAITNLATVTSTTIDGQNIALKQDDARITVIDEDATDPGLGVGSFRKDSFGQLRDTDAAPSPSGQGLEANSHTTYPGNWLGFRANQSGNPLSGYTPNQATGMTQAGYKMQYNSGVGQGAGFQVALTDPVPCLTNKTDQVYRSNPVGTLCQEPAFHVKTVSVWSSTSGGVAPITAGWVPQVRYADGSVADMVSGNGGSNHKNFAIPADSRPIAEIVFPRDEGLSGPTINWAVYGYVDPQVVDGEILKNISSGEVFWKNQATLRGTVTDDADLYVVDGPQIGIEKDLGNRNAAGTDKTTMSLTARLLTSGEAAEDFVVTDLLPSQMSVDGTPAAPTATITHADGAGEITTSTVTGQVEVLPNFAGTGRQLVRVVFPAADLAAYGALRAQTTINFQVAYVNEPGTYNNTAQVYYTDDALLATCQQSPPYAQQGAEDIDLNGNGSRDDHFCYSQDSLSIPAQSGPAAFRTAKTVQGDSDEAPRAYPAVARVTQAGGTVAFGLSWRNIGGAPLDSAVIYDIFPIPGDVGVGGSVAGLPRKSEFTTVVTSLEPLPAGVQVEVSRAANPCRDEVFPNSRNTDCVDDWEAGWPTEAADLAEITAARFTSDRVYQPGEGFEVTFHATTPEIELGQIAWNSIAGAASTTGPTGAPLLPNSPPKVGLTAVGTDLPLILEKTLDPSIDTDDIRVGDVLTYHLSASNPDAVAKVLDEVDTLPAGLEFVAINGVGSAPDTPPEVSVDGREISFNAISIPTGATYRWTVEARVLPGAIGEQVNTFGDQQVPITVEPVSLTVAKTVSGTGTQFAAADFPIAVVCTAGGVEVLEETFDLADGEDEVLEVPQGSTCSVTETDDAGATGVTYTLDGDPYVAGAPIAIGTSGAFEVAIDNRFDAGALVINKLLDGVGSDFGESFEFEVDCTFGGASVADFPQTVTLTAPDDLTSDELGPLPVGAECVVTETDSGGADSTPAPISVDIVENADDNVAEVTFTNVFSAATISVAKDLAGDYAATGAVDDFEFTIDVTCSFDGHELWTRSVTLAGGERITLTDVDDNPVLLPVGTVCSAAEPDPNGASVEPVITGPVTAEVGHDDEPQDLELRVTNTFDDARLVIDKTITGVGAELAEGPFVFDVSCAFQGAPVPGVPAQVTLTRAGGATTLTSDPITDLPVGAVCAVTETETSYADTTPDPVTLTVSAQDDDPENTATAAFENSYSAGTIAVTKQVDGAYADSPEVEKLTFKIAVTCTLTRGATTTELVAQTLKVKGGETVTVTDADGTPRLLPVGTACWAAEEDPRGATETTVDFDSATTATTVVAGQPEQLQDLAVTVTNVFDADLSPQTETDDTDAGTDDAGAEKLPGTGGFALGLLGLALALCVAGVTLIARRRREA